MTSLLQDNFTQAWDPDVIAEVVKPYIVAHNITAVCLPSPLVRASLNIILDTNF